MSGVTVVETCSCEASLRLDGVTLTDALAALAEWRSVHRHAVRAEWRGDHGGESSRESTVDVGEPTLGFRRDGAR